MSAVDIAGLLVAGAVGAVARAALTAALRWRWRCGSATATAIVNVSGAAALGIVLGSAGMLGPTLTQWLAGGFLGAFTTYATWMHDTASTWRAGRRGVAVLHAASLLVVGVSATAALRAVVGAAAP